MKILGIETSCDETSCAVIESKNNNIVVLSCILRTQIDPHSQYGGVVPSLAAREHVINLPIVLKEALKKAKCTMNDIDIVAVTSGPGLIPALLVGVSFAQGLAYKFKKPLIATNHMEGHIYSNWLPPIASSSKLKVLNSRQSVPKLNDKQIFPSLQLIVSGGHTQLILMKGHGKYKLLGQTLDDAAGEAFDKIGRMLGLPHPCGPRISKLALEFNPQSPIRDPHSQIPIITLPRPMIHSKDYNFSFSGLKTSVLYTIGKYTDFDMKKIQLGSNKAIPKSLTTMIAYETQQAIVDVLVSKTQRAVREFKAKSIMLSGGVSANNVLRERLQAIGNELDIYVFIPNMDYTTDNAAMIAMATIANIKRKKLKPKYNIYDIKKIRADANWEIV